MIDIQTPQSDGWWLNRLSRKLRYRQPRLALLASHIEGDPPLPEGTDPLRRGYVAFLRNSRTNFAELVSEAVRERMQIVGWRTSALNDEIGDKAAWDLWVSLGLPVSSADVHASMTGLGDGYGIVGWDNDRSQPVATAEDPRQCVTIHDPLDQRRVRAGAKFFHDDEMDLDLAFLYLPGRVRVAVRRRRAPIGTVSAVPLFTAAWDWADELGMEMGGPLPAGMERSIVIVRFRNRNGVSEFERHLDLLNRINGVMLQRLFITAYQAFRQRAIKGDLPTKDKDGVDIDYDALFSADPGALWQLPDGVDLWESGQVDLTPILSSVKDDVAHLAAVTRTPMHMLHPDSANQTAEGAATAKEGLTFKTEDRIMRATQGWMQMQSLAFRFLGDTARASLTELAPIWAPVERHSLSEKAAASAQASDVPWRTKMRTIWQFPPDELARMEAERADDALLARALTAAAPPKQLAPTFLAPTAIQ